MYDPSLGFGGLDAVQLTNRLLLGTFFAISGYHKLFNRERRATVEATFKEDGCYSPVLMWVIPGGEFLGGMALISGFLTPLAAVGLIIICSGACLLDGVKRIRAWQPIDRADVVDDVLYLPEVLYVIMLGFVLALGPGNLSLDTLIWRIINA